MYLANVGYSRYLYERAERFAVSVSGISAAIKRLGFSRKKACNISRQTHKQEQNLNQA
jgi:hypothetical protein